MTKALILAWDIFLFIGDVAWFSMGCVGAYATIRWLMKGGKQ